MLHNQKTKQSPPTHLVSRCGGKDGELGLSWLSGGAQQPPAHRRPRLLVLRQQLDAGRADGRLRGDSRQLHTSPGTASRY